MLRTSTCNRLVVDLLYGETGVMDSGLKTIRITSYLVAREKRRHRVSEVDYRVATRDDNSGYSAVSVLS